jgi:penicillin-binding protein 1A
LQNDARDAVNAYYADPAGPSSAIVAIDPANGKIRAMASTGSYADSNFNLAAQGHRQPGSSFKTFVLTAAVRKGVDPDSTYYTSKPLNIDDPTYGHWEVKTFGNTYIGNVSLTRATLASDNTVYAQLILDIGPKAVCETAKLLGITTKLDCYPAEGLGGLTLGVTPLEMAGAYATLASGGIRHRPTGIQKVIFPDGKSEDLGNTKGKRVLTDGEAYEVTNVLHQNVLGGTGTRANYGCPAAGKTGTTDEAKDAWFVGYTPELAAAVWVGYPKAGIPMPGAQGGTLAAPVWNTFMVPAHGDFCGDFPQPTEPAQLSPYFGKYARTGSSGSSGSYYGPGTGTTTPDDQQQQYDPRFYEQAPLDKPNEAPPEQVAPEAPPPGNGNGNGNGGGGGQPKQGGVGAPG